MELLTLPKLDAYDEHIFYVMEGSMLQLFGQDSYPVFMSAAFEKKVHSLAHMAVNDFIVFSVKETMQELNRPLDGWDAEERQVAMLQGMCVRRCLFPPIFEMLDDTCGAILQGAIVEERVGGDRLLRDAIQDALNERFDEIGKDPYYSEYLENNERTQKLQIDNMHRMFIHCEAFALKNQWQYVVGQIVSTTARRDYLQRQFPFILTIMKDYLTREMRKEEEYTTCLPQ